MRNRVLGLTTILVLGVVSVYYAPAAQTALATVRFQDVAREAGLSYVLHNCPTPQKQMIETMAGGLAVFDYDADGRPDIFFTNGAELPSLAKTGAQYWNRL